MGLDLTIARGEASLDALLAQLAQGAFSSTVMMLDGALVAPGAPAPTGWRDARLRTPGGTVAVKRTAAGYQVVVFGNADAALLAARDRVAEALRALP
jgi:hypothetical protein